MTRISLALLGLLAILAIPMTYGVPIGIAMMAFAFFLG